MIYYDIIHDFRYDCSTHLQNEYYSYIIMKLMEGKKWKCIYVLQIIAVKQQHHQQQQ